MGDKEMSDNNISDKNTFTAEVITNEKTTTITGDFEIADFLSEKDVYEELFRCRDFELSHLWQRSVFLATFILGLAVAYGTLAIKILFPEENSCIKDIHHIAAVGLCILGIIFSFLWIMMAKGSKQWTERYENAISNCHWVSKCSANISNDAGFYGNLAPLEPKKVSSSILSPMAWCFSPSRINAVIGIVALFAWSSLTAVHVGLLIKKYCNELQSNNIALALLGVAVTLIIDTIILCILWILCETGEYKNSDKDSKNKKNNMFSNILQIIKFFSV